MVTTETRRHTGKATMRRSAYHAMARIRSPRVGTAIALLVSIWLVLCTPWFLEGKTVPWDSKDQFYPFLSFVAHSLRTGELPLWNPSVNSGYPMVSDPQSMIFSPIAVLSMLIPAQPSLHWFDGIELLHILLAGIGMLVLLVRLGRSTPAALFAALVYMYGGSASGRMQHVPMIFAYSYFPFALCALDGMLATKKLRWAMSFGLIAGVMAAHQNQVSYLFSLALLGYLIYRAVSSGSPKKFLAESWRGIAAATITGAATLAVPLYLTLQFLPLSNRLKIPYEIAIAADSMRPLTMLTLFIRNFFGNARPNSYWGLGDVTETYLYAGTLPIVLIARHGIGNGILFERQFRYFLYVGIAAVLYALGGFTPFYWIVYHVLPGVSLYRRPTDATFVLNMVLAVACGFVMDRIAAGAAGRLRPFVLSITGILVAGLFILGLHYAAVEHKLQSMTKDLLLAAVFIGLSLLLLQAIAAARLEQWRLMLVFTALFLLVLDMGVHSVGSRLNAERDEFSILETNALQADPVAKFVRNGLDSEKETGPYRADIFWAGSLWANAPMILGIQSTQGYNPLQYALYNRIAGKQDFPKARLFSPLLPTYGAPMLNLLGVRYIVSSKTLSEIDSTVTDGRFPLVFEKNGLRVWRNPNAMPRVMAATSIYVEPDLEGAINDGKLAPVDYRSTVVLTHLPKTLAIDDAVERIIPLATRDRPVVRIQEYANNQVTLTMEGTGDAILVLNDLYYPYWRVYVDGTERELLQANYMFRGVHVRDGDKKVVFRFEPFSWPAIHGTFKRLLR